MGTTLSIDEQMAARMAAQYAEQMGTVIPSAAPVIPPPVAPVVEAPIVPPVATPDPVVIDPVVSPVVNVVESPALEPVKVKSFDEEFAERFKGKTVADVEQALTPKEFFANDKIKHLNELASKGVDVTSKEFLELQSLDVDKLDKVDDILFEAWKRGEEGKGLSDKTIKFEINKKYNVNEWIDKEDSELTDEDYANREKMSRDGNLKLEWLKAYKNERVLEKQVDPSVSMALAQEATTRQNNWEGFVDSDLVNKITKMSSPISYKDETGKVVESEFNFEISEQDRKEVGQIMKQLTKDSDTFFNQFKDDKGSPNHNALFTMMLKARNYDKAVALASSDGAERRALAIERASKNTNFTQASSGAPVAKVLTMQEALAEGIKNMKIY